MGLDMYLMAREKGGSKDDNHEVAYWRKANAIHGWFEREVANGAMENCKEYQVTIEDLVRLRDVCLDVLSRRSTAVPTNSEDYVKVMDSPDSMANMMVRVQEMMEQEASKVRTLAYQIDNPDPLPPTQGLFFGSDEKDDYYYSMVEYTIEQVNAILASHDEDTEYYYHGWW